MSGACAASYNAAVSRTKCATCDVERAMCFSNSAVRCSAVSAASARRGLSAQTPCRQ